MIKIEELTPEEAAKIVAKVHNNPGMESSFLLYFKTLSVAGLVIGKPVS